MRANCGGAQKETPPPGVGSCAQCLGPLRNHAIGGFCSHECEVAHKARGGDLIRRCDLQELHRIFEEQDRKFPMLIAELLASLLAGLRAAGGASPAWQHAAALVHAVIPQEGMPQVEEEHRALLAAFAATGVTDLATLQLLLPLPRYTQLLGAAQLNAFELRTGRGLLLSCLLPSEASCFNHHCDPNTIVSCGETHDVAFVTGRDVQAGEELCISYVDLGLSVEERQRIFQYKYAFTCDCPRCVAEGQSS